MGWRRASDRKIHRASGNLNRLERWGRNGAEAGKGGSRWFLESDKEVSDFSILVES